MNDPNSFSGLDLLNDEQAAELLQTNKRTLRQWRYTRGLPFIRITSRMIRYRKSDIEQWLERRRVAIAA